MDRPVQQTSDDTGELLVSLREKGVRLWEENGQLRYQSTREALTRAEIDRLKLAKVEIIAILQGRGSTKDVCGIGGRGAVYRAPLAFSQLAHWNLYQLFERPAIRQIASVTRLIGHLDTNILRRSFEEIVRRHEALRTRVVVADGVPMQEVRAKAEFEFVVDDMSAVVGGYEEAMVMQAVEQHVLKPIDVAVDALFGVRLLRFANDDHVLILAMEHLISDMHSLSIVRREAMIAYQQLSVGDSVSLPPVSLQFPAFAIWQRSTMDAWMAKRAEHWRTHLMGCGRLQFPNDKDGTSANTRGWATVLVEIGPDKKRRLTEWCRAKRSTLVMAVLTACVALVLRWCNARDSVVWYQSDGRFGPNVKNTVGYIALPLYLRVGFGEKESFVDLLERVTKAYCLAYENSDFTYLAAQIPRPGFTRNFAFNWIPNENGAESSHPERSGCPLTLSPVRFSHPMVTSLDSDVEPFVVFHEGAEEICGDVYFSLARFSMRSMERFASNLVAFIDVMLATPERYVQEVPLV